ncbi:hypothetical protein PAPHI01_0513 [Pancytospora philotis]|nr:hypothetical protein PAPHI01_0513 [Pancytospora philotis]
MSAGGSWYHTTAFIYGYSQRNSMHVRSISSTPQANSICPYPAKSALVTTDASTETHAGARSSTPDRHINANLIGHVPATWLLNKCRHEARDACQIAVYK